MLVPEIAIDAAIELSDITPKFFRILKQFEPFGPENLPPIFITKDLVDNNKSRIVGKDHLKFDIQAEPNSDQCFSAIGFGLGNHLDAINNKHPFNACYNVEENEFNGRVTMQLNVKDIKMA
jgi:single-stranded-DNA-specific exonuclease